MIKINFFTAIALSLIINSCSGQKSKNEIKESISSDKKLEKNKPNTSNSENFLFYSEINNQISQVVRTIFQDSKGIIWFGTQNGAFKFDGNSLIHIDSIKNESGKGVTIKDIAEDKDGIIWFGHEGGISSIDKKVVTNYYESDGLISNDVWCITTDKSNQVWIGTIQGVCKFDGKNFTSFELPQGEIDSTLGISSAKMVHSIFEDSKGTLWFSSNAGLFSYANNSLLNVSEAAGIQSNFVNEVFEDKNGELWVSTKNGLYSLIDNKAKNITKGKIETGKGIGSIAEDKDGNIWFVSNQHYLFIYDGNELIEYKKSDDNKGPVVFQILKDKDNETLVRWFWRCL
ncbi:two-component regulator propeller domain-containing protein [Tenacibaculum tangerinum]|uniref:Two-component regulator propeller domain-containing protein n=1 Tax=Tenacibaculum tangerinum TaxID=3038772 RepID=A0ABY8L6F3_9FLAO|nr:two-component regulator propeller domain-containing protein [Tenacibaculum tangerinum]WGH75644.1 two-component regulator propeller domain-containing protein [Tenacibaculum tangerinum]